MPTKTHDSTAEVPVRKAGTNGHTSLRDRILAAQDLRTEDVEVPEWGVTVTVRGLTGSARDWLEMRYTDQRGRMDRDKASDFRAAFAALSIIDPETGERVFTDNDIKALGQKSSLALQRVYDVATRLSAASAEDVDGIVEDLKADPSGATGSD